jgi:hypothetical protein
MLILKGSFTFAASVRQSTNAQRRNDHAPECDVDAEGPKKRLYGPSAPIKHALDNGREPLIDLRLLALLQGLDALLHVLIDAPRCSECEHVKRPPEVGSKSQNRKTPSRVLITSDRQNMGRRPGSYQEGCEASVCSFVYRRLALAQALSWRF